MADEGKPSWMNDKKLVGALGKLKVRGPISVVSADPETPFLFLSDASHLWRPRLQRKIRPRSRARSTDEGRQLAELETNAELVEQYKKKKVLQWYVLVVPHKAGLLVHARAQSPKTESPDDPLLLASTLPSGIATGARGPAFRFETSRGASAATA